MDCWVCNGCYNVVSSTVCCFHKSWVQNLSWRVLHAWLLSIIDTTYPIIKCMLEWMHIKEWRCCKHIGLLCWWLTAAICFMTPDANINSNDNNQTTAVATAVEMPSTTEVATETTTQRVEEDGTTVVEQVITKPDGTTTCTATIIPPAAVPVTDSNFYEHGK
eukprot:900210_1